MKENITIGFIGTGNMGTAIIGGIIDAGICSPDAIRAFDVDASRLSKIAEKYSIQQSISNAEVVRESTHIILAVKPQNMRDAFEDIRDAVTDKQCLISIAAGITTAFIEEMLDKKVRVIRVMPNTPALIKQGATAFAPGTYASGDDMHLAEKIFSALGVAIAVEEKHLNAVTALSGSGPAYFFHLIECLIDAGVNAGLPRELAGQLTTQTAKGAARLALESSDSPAELRRKVTSPGGTTEAALNVFSQYKFPDIVTEAIQKATDRAEELSKQS